MHGHIFKISSYIQKTTQNPISALKITIHNTKTHHKYTHTFQKFIWGETKLKTKNNNNFYFIIYQDFITHILYSLYILYILYILNFLYTRIREGPINSLQLFGTSFRANLLLGEPPSWGLLYCPLGIVAAHLVLLLAAPTAYAFDDRLLDPKAPAHLWERAALGSSYLKRAHITN